MKKTPWIVFVAFLTMAVALWGQSITVTVPNATSNWCVGSTYTITWTSAGVTGNVDIILRPAHAPTAPPIMGIAVGTANDASESWPIPASLAPGNYLVRIRSIDNPSVYGDSADFKIIACLQAHPPQVQLNPLRTFAMPVTFHTSMKQRERHSANCLARMGTGAIDVPPSEMLVGFFNRREDRGPLCVDECVSQIYRSSPVWDAARLRPLVGKTLVSAVLTFRHKNTEASSPGGICLKSIYWYSGPMGEAASPTISPPLPVVLSGTYRIDVTEMMRNWLREEDPSYHGESHNYSMEFVGCNERMEYNSQKCLSWFDSGSLEIQYRN